MTASNSNFALLMELAKEPSSEKRRALLVQISGMLSEDPATGTSANCAAFDEIAVAIVADLKTEARAEIAQRFANTALPLGRTSRQLAMDDIKVARPILERSRALTESDLLEVVGQKSQEHLMAVTKRGDIGEKVSEALVTRGNDQVVGSLLVNRSAKIARNTYERITERAQTSPVLQAPLVRRQGVPLDLLNDLFESAASELRQEILKQYENVSPDELEAALKRSRERVAKAYNGMPEDLDAAKRSLLNLEKTGDLKPLLLVRLMREGQPSRTLFLLAFAKLTDVDFQVVLRLIDKKDIDALALLCRAAGFDRALLCDALPVRDGRQPRPRQSRTIRCSVRTGAGAGRSASYPFLESAAGRASRGSRRAALSNGQLKRIFRIGREQRQSRETREPMFAHIIPADMGKARLKMPRRRLGRDVSDRIALR